MKKDMNDDVISLIPSEYPSNIYAIKIDVKQKKISERKKRNSEAQE